MDGNICGNNAEAFNKDKLKCFGYSIYNESLYSGLLNTYFINKPYDKTEICFKIDRNKVILFQPINHKREEFINHTLPFEKL